MLLKFTVPLPPSSNHRLMATKNGLIKAPLYRRWMDSTAEDLSASFEGCPPRLEGRLMLYVEVVFPDRRKRDIDNVLKSLCDVLTKAEVYKDDSQLDVITVRRSEVQKPGELRCALWCIDDYNPFANWSINGHQNPIKTAGNCTDSQ